MLSNNMCNSEYVHKFLLCKAKRKICMQMLYLHMRRITKMAGFVFLIDFFSDFVVKK